MDKVFSEKNHKGFIRVLGIDPSTVATGVAILDIDLSRHLSRSGIVVRHSIELSQASDKTTLLERFQRMRAARRDLSLFVASCPEIDIVAYENPFHQGGASTAALFQAIGMYFSLTQFDGLPVYQIATGTVKKEQGLSSRAKAKVDASIPNAKNAKKDVNKQLAVEWANTRVTFPTPLTAKQDAIADAAAVAIAAFHQWQDEQYLKEITQAGQGSLNLRRSPSRKK